MRYFLVFILLLQIFFLQGNANADTTSEENRAAAAQNGVPTSFNGALATAPECLLDANQVINAALTLTSGVITYVSGGLTLVSGMKTVFITPVKSAAQIALGISLIGLGVAQFIYLSDGTLGYGRCLASFVRDPVMYYPDIFPDGHPDAGKGLDGKMKKYHFDPNKPFTTFDKTDNYWEAIPATGVDKVTFCARGMFPVGLWRTDGCYKQGIHGGLAFKKDDMFTKNPNFNGENSVLCPEEYRISGRYATDPDERGLRKLQCTEALLGNCSDKQVDKVNLKSSQFFEDYKLIFDFDEKKYCAKDVKKNEIRNLHGYDYKIVDQGSQLCVLMSKHMLFNAGGATYKIGCVPKLTYNVAPKCSASVPIYEDFHVDPDTGIITHYGTPNSTYKVIQYDNSLCPGYQMLDRVCTSIEGKMFQSPFPFSAYLVGCIKRTVENVLFGRSLVVSYADTETGGTKTEVRNEQGMLGLIQKRLWPIILAVLSISIGLFGFNTLFGDSTPKQQEIIVYMLKIAMVIYFTREDAVHGGMRIYSKYLTEISNFLQAAVLNVGTTRGLCDYKQEDYRKSYALTDGTMHVEDYSDLMALDIIDCRVAYYLSTMMTGQPAKYINATNPAPLDETIFSKFSGLAAIQEPQIILMVVPLILFFIFFIGMLAQMLEILITSFVIYALLILLSSVFVICTLFKPLQRQFDGWINAVVAFSLYPVIMFAFLGFLFLITDNMIFGNTKFTGTQADGSKIMGWVSGRNVQIFAIAPNSTTENCTGFTVGHENYGEIPEGCDCNGTHCAMHALVTRSYKTIGRSSGSATGDLASGPLGFMPSNSIKADSAASSQFSMHCISLAFLMFVLYQMSKTIHGLFNALTGGGMLTLGQIAQTAFSGSGTTEFAAQKAIAGVTYLGGKGAGLVKRATPGNALKSPSKKGSGDNSNKVEIEGNAKNTRNDSNISV